MSSTNFGSTDLREIRHFHLFCGLGGGARGFNRGGARIGNMQAMFRCLGGIDECVDISKLRNGGAAFLPKGPQLTQTRADTSAKR